MFAAVFCQAKAHREREIVQHKRDNTAADDPRPAGQIDQGEGQVMRPVHLLRLASAVCHRLDVHWAVSPLRPARKSSHRAPSVLFPIQPGNLSAGTTSTLRLLCPTMVRNVTLNSF